MENEKWKMTPEAAIIELNRCKIEGYAPVDVDRRNMAIEMAKAALRKQIPVKTLPPDIIMGRFNPTDYKCPTCKNTFPEEYETPFCGQCGQAFDLSD